MYIPLPFRLTFLSISILGLTLCCFGWLVYSQAEQQAYHTLDTMLSSRAASVRLGKDILIASNNTSYIPSVLASVNGLGDDSVAIEVLDAHLNLLAGTNPQQDNGLQPGVDGVGYSPVPWDSQAIHTLLTHHDITSIYSTITYAHQQIRIYTLLNNDFGNTYFIQTARAETSIAQSLNSLLWLMLQGGVLALLLATLSGFFISYGILARVQRITRTARQITQAHNFHQRVPSTSTAFPVHDELATLTQTLNEMLASLETVYQQQQRFLADASHELRAPLTSLRCNLDLLATAPDLPSSEAQAALADARAEAQRMTHLVNDLFTLTRGDEMQSSKISTEIGYMKYESQVVDLDTILLDIFRQYRSVATSEDDSKAGPRLLLQHITPIQIRGNADKLKQAIVVLLDNALKYTPSTGVISLSLTHENMLAHLAIHDNGQGIAPQDLPHIFERFYRADPARKSSGSGLGLAIAQSIIQEHHGRIDVASTIGQGSTFTVILPIAE